MTYPRQRVRVSLQAKVTLIVALLIISVAVVGGWFYLEAATSMLRSQDQQHAFRLGQAVGLLCQQDLLEGRQEECRRLIRNFVRSPGLKYAAVLDAQGKVVASCSSEANLSGWDGLKIPVTLSSTQVLPKDLLVLAQPIVGDMDQSQARLAGAVRLVLDTHTTSDKLARTRLRVWVIASALVILAIPLGYLLVWRVFIQPLQLLVAAARRLAGEDFSTRTGMQRNDEMGQLGLAFDTMAEQIAQSRQRLVEANERLESKVEHRTEELEIANRRLRDEMAEKDDFLRAVSHDLNAPLHNIGGLAAMTLRKWREQLPQEVTARLERIRANVEAESILISELLELSHIRSRPERREAVDFAHLLREQALSFEYALHSRNIELKIHGEMPTLYVEKNRVRKVFQNLIDNAIKYMNRTEGGRIEMEYRRGRTFHEFRVCDNGPGVPQGQEQAIFNIFRRGESQESSRVEGKGVGLAVVKAVVSNYEGRAWVESHEGIGANFCFTLSATNTEVPVDLLSGQRIAPGTSARFRSSPRPASVAAADTEHCTKEGQ
ncbi:MAG: HAMP domain-containing sensor histidine kinase [Phycisphaerae bacterium]|jgi:signal transduction histidine kinase